MKKKSLICRALPAELLDEIFGSLPLENGLGMLAKMPNGLLARNLRKMIKNAMKKNKWDVANCGSKLTISGEGLIVKQEQYGGFNSVRAQLPFSKKLSISYFEVEIVKIWQIEGNWLGYYQDNSIGIWNKGGIWVDGSKANFGIEGNEFHAKDVIGIGIARFPANSTTKFFASYNGQLLGMVKLPMKFANLQLFPTIIMYGYGNSISANFGMDPWRYNPHECVHDLL